MTEGTTIMTAEEAAQSFFSENPNARPEEIVARAMQYSLYYCTDFEAASAFDEQFANEYKRLRIGKRKSKMVVEQTWFDETVERNWPESRY
jgi:hypothetical protein